MNIHNKSLLAPIYYGDILFYGGKGFLCSTLDHFKLSKLFEQEIGFNQKFIYSSRCIRSILKNSLSLEKISMK